MLFFLSYSFLLFLGKLRHSCICLGLLTPFTFIIVSQASRQGLALSFFVLALTSYLDKSKLTAPVIFFSFASFFCHFSILPFSVFVLLSSNLIVFFRSNVCLFLTKLKLLSSFRHTFLPALLFLSLFVIYFLFSVDDIFYFILTNSTNRSIAQSSPVEYNISLFYFISSLTLCALTFMSSRLSHLPNNHLVSLLLCHQYLHPYSPYSLSMHYLGIFL